jgi:hypothetical protein
MDSDLNQCLLMEERTIPIQSRDTGRDPPDGMSSAATDLARLAIAVARAIFQSFEETLLAEKRDDFAEYSSITNVVMTGLSHVEDNVYVVGLLWQDSDIQPLLMSSEGLDVLLQQGERDMAKSLGLLLC